MKRQMVNNWVKNVLKANGCFEIVIVDREYIDSIHVYGNSIYSSEYNFNKTFKIAHKLYNNENRIKIGGTLTLFSKDAYANDRFIVYDKMAYDVFDDVRYSKEETEKLFKAIKDGYDYYDADNFFDEVICSCKWEEELKFRKQYKTYYRNLNSALNYAITNFRKEVLELNKVNKSYVDFSRDTVKSLRDTLLDEDYNTTLDEMKSILKDKIEFDYQYYVNKDHKAAFEFLVGKLSEEEKEKIAYVSKHAHLDFLYEDNYPILSSLFDYGINWPRTNDTVNKRLTSIKNHIQYGYDKINELLEKGGIENIEFKSNERLDAIAEDINPVYKERAKELSDSIGIDFIAYMKTMFVEHGHKIGNSFLDYIIRNRMDDFVKAAYDCYKGYWGKLWQFSDYPIQVAFSI